MEEYFSFTERNTYHTTDNLINYSAGPVDISISGWSREVVLKLSSTQWAYMLNDLERTAMAAWDFKECDIVYKDALTLKLSLNYNSICLYIEHNILFM